MSIKGYIRAFFKQGHERTLLAKKNILISFLLKGAGIGMSVLLIPITIKYVNPTQYGVWLILTSIVSWFNYFDIGFGNGLKNRLAETNALKKYKLSRVYVSSTYCVLSIMSASIFVLFLISNHFLDWHKILNVSSGLIGNLNQIVILVFGFFCIQFVFQLIHVVLTAVHATSKVSLISFISQATAFIIILILIKCTNGSLIYLVIVFGLTPIIVQLLASIWFYNKQYNFLAPSIQLVHLKKAKGLLSVGGYFFVIQIGALILFETDNIVIVQLFGPKEVTAFNIAFKLFSILINVFTIIMTPFWSAFTDAYTKKDFNWIRSVFTKLYKYWIILMFVCLVLAVFSSFIFRLWIGQVVNVPISLSISMAFYVAGFTWLMIHCYLLNGIGKIRLQFYLYILSVMINIPLAVILGNLFGLAGVTLANVFIFVYMGIVFYIQCKKLMNQSAAGIWAK